ncbi:hypothetical protein [Aromatoleum sp.]|uniref:hypothetical protein n=1 Tax=Aromatoleum sp. TaxID=2307007 RepID=UPI002FCA2B37
MPATRLTPLLLLLLLAGCDQLGALLELPDPQREAATMEAEGKAIGGACRHSGRALEDCYLLNAKAQKAAVFSGWREMNDYMMQNNMQTVPSGLSQSAQTATTTSPSADVADARDTNVSGPAVKDTSSRRSRTAP